MSQRCTTDRQTSRALPGVLRDLAIGRTIDAPVALVVAHPDDETLGVGARLPCLPRLVLIHLTDGAPEAAAAGAERREAIAAQRARELDDALEALGATPERRIAYRCPDQGTVANFEELVLALRDDLANVAAVLTHAYEHGHPDHDTAALAVHTACALRAEVGAAPEILEFPSYHLAADGARFGVFWPDPQRREWVARLDAAERQRKTTALACFTSQREMLQNFPLDVERFRRAPNYDFSAPAPPPAAWYDERHWEIDSHAWRQLAQRGLQRLGLPPDSLDLTACRPSLASPAAPGGARAA